MTLEDGLPPSVAEIVQYLAGKAKGYGNKLKFNERDKLKGDLMNAPERWRSVDVDAFAAKCLSEGMRDADVAELVVLVIKAQNGRRLVPSHFYKTFKFGFPIEA